MPGIFVQTPLFASMTSGFGLAYDLKKGLIDRFRSLPMAGSAVLAGRTTTDLLRNMFVVHRDHAHRRQHRVGFRFHGTTSGRTTCSVS